MAEDNTSNTGNGLSKLAGNLTKRSLLFATPGNNSKIAPTKTSGNPQAAAGDVTTIISGIPFNPTLQNLGRDSSRSMDDLTSSLIDVSGESTNIQANFTVIAQQMRNLSVFMVKLDDKFNDQDKNFKRTIKDTADYFQQRHDSIVTRIDSRINNLSDSFERIIERVRVNEKQLDDVLVEFGNMKRKEAAESFFTEKKRQESSVGFWEKTGKRRDRSDVDHENDTFGGGFENMFDELMDFLGDHMAEGALGVWLARKGMRGLSRGLKGGARVIGKGASKAGRAVARGAKPAARVVGRGAVEAGRLAGRGAVEAGRLAGQGAAAAGRGAVKAGKHIVARSTEAFEARVARRAAEKAAAKIAAEKALTVGAEKLGAKVAAQTGARLIGRLLPGVGIGLSAWDFYEGYKDDGFSGGMKNVATLGMYEALGGSGKKPGDKPPPIVQRPAYRGRGIPPLKPAPIPTPPLAAEKEQVKENLSKDVRIETTGDINLSATNDINLRANRILTLKGEKIVLDANIIDIKGALNIGMIGGKTTGPRHDARSHWRASGGFQKYNSEQVWQNFLQQGGIAPGLAQMGATLGAGPMGGVAGGFGGGFSGARSGVTAPRRGGSGSQKLPEIPVQQSMLTQLMGGSTGSNGQQFLHPRNNPNINPAMMDWYNKHPSAAPEGLPASFRTNNPGAISITGSPDKINNSFAAQQPGFVGVIPRPANEGGWYAKYATPEYGIAAQATLLRKYAASGRDTVATILRDWAAMGQGSYIAKVAQEMGVNPNEKLDLNDPKVMKQFLIAQSKYESGAHVAPYRDDVYERGVTGKFNSRYEGPNSDKVVKIAERNEQLLARSKTKRLQSLPETTAATEEDLKNPKQYYEKIAKANATRKSVGLPTQSPDNLIAKAAQGKIDPGSTAVQNAMKQLGLNENRDRQALISYLKGGEAGGAAPVDPATTAWCASFVNASLTRSGIKGSGSAAAGSFQRYGQAVTDPTKVKAGDPVVNRLRSPRTGMLGSHVAMATGPAFQDANGRWMIPTIGGNQSSQVSQQNVPFDSWNVREPMADELPTVRKTPLLPGAEKGKNIRDLLMRSRAARGHTGDDVNETTPQRGGDVFTTTHAQSAAHRTQKRIAAYQRIQDRVMRHDPKPAQSMRGHSDPKPRSSPVMVQNPSRTQHQSIMDPKTGSVRPGAAPDPKGVPTPPKEKPAATSKGSPEPNNGGKAGGDSKGQQIANQGHGNTSDNSGDSIPPGPANDGQGDYANCLV